jgi:hypothetical protein
LKGKKCLCENRSAKEERNDEVFLKRAWLEKAGKTEKKPLTILHQAVINVAYA